MMLQKKGTNADIVLADKAGRGRQGNADIG